MRLSKRIASTTLKIRMHCQSNKSQTLYHGQENPRGLKPAFCSLSCPITLYHGHETPMPLALYLFLKYARFLPVLNAVAFSVPSA